ncbi:MAG TPA: hypothetical protein VKE88_02580, partial [Candidatus Nanoarchaeia archaeon]|nr:hypothetical protein [Candidatus Nanoarchaeia archaeon]
VSNCIDQIAQEAIRKLAMQGGYIDATKVVVNEMNPTQGQGLYMSPGSDIVVPYWYYMKSPNDCTANCEFETRQPPLYRRAGTGNSIEDQIDMYVEQKLSTCIGDFSPFEGQFEIKQNTIDAITTVAKTEVFVQTTYPISITLPDGRISQMSKFTNRIPVNLGKFYDLAAELTTKEIQTTYLSSFMINTVSSYTGIDENALPPLAEFSFDPHGQKSWLQSNVRSKIEELLMIYSPALQATGTSNFKGNLYSGDNELASGLYDFFILPLNQTYKANAEFSYLAWWPTYLKITPSDGEFIKPDSISGVDSVLSALGLNQYKFAYDVSFPVLVSLSDEDAFGGQGFTFQFALESNTRNNAPIKGDTSLISFSGREGRSLACNPEQFNSGNITVDVSDSVSEKPVEDVLVYYSFGREACLIGVTTLTNGKATLVSPMPVGIGSLVFVHDDYLSKTIKFSTAVSEKQELSVVLDPYLDFDVSFARLQTILLVPHSQCDELKASEEQIEQNCNGPVRYTVPLYTNYCYQRTYCKSNTDEFCTYLDSKDLKSICGKWLPRPPVVEGLEPTQNLVVSMSRVQENEAQEEFVVSFEVKGNDTETQKIRLVPGTYSIDATLFNNQRIIIPAKEECYPDDFWDSIGIGEKKCETIPAVTFEKFPQGGLTVSSVLINQSDLKDKTNMKIVILEMPSLFKRDSSGVTDLRHADLKVFGNIEKYSADYASSLRLKFT